jgi:hypothetical protein
MAIVTRDEVKTFLQISDTSKDTLIDSLIPQVEADFLIIRNKAFDEDSNDVIEYPDNCELVASQMIGFHMTSMAQSGGAFQSESIGSYSYTAKGSEDNILGYPKQIVSRIERYVGLV